MKTIYANNIVENKGMDSTYRYNKDGSVTIIHSKTKESDFGGLSDFTQKLQQQAREWNAGKREETLTPDEIDARQAEFDQYKRDNAY